MMNKQLIDFALFKGFNIEEFKKYLKYVIAVIVILMRVPDPVCNIKLNDAPPPVLRTLAQKNINSQ